MTRSAQALQAYLDLIEESYSKKTWHGPNLRGSLRGVSARKAAARPAPGRHNIWEIAVHCAYWKYIVRRRILGERRGSFPLKGSNWFRRPGTLSEEAWRTDLALLRRCHEGMVKAVRTLSPSALGRTPRGSTVSTRAILRGIALHDVYHAGQIQLLKRLIR
ncbi:MAG: DinB family protein [Ignavibacteriales bacterium]|nr:DinB family protein [Ignavibacteriales bacterium]